MFPNPNPFLVMTNLYNPFTRLLPFPVKSLLLPAGLMLMAGFAHAQAPVITSVSPASGPLGSTVTITGTDFGSTIADNKLFFGPVQATITDANANAITAQVPAGAIYRNLRLTTNYLTTQSTVPFKVTFPGEEVINSTSFGRLADIDAPNTSGATVTADFDGDGKTDLVTGTTTATLLTFRNTSVGDNISFQAGTQSGSGSVKWLSAADLNGDGKTDIVAIKHGNTTNPLVVFRNTSTPGTISFTVDNTVSYPGYSPAALAITDIDGDGKPDIIGVNELNSSFSIVRNTGVNGSFAYAAVQHFPLQNSAVSLRIVAGRFNDDTNTDIVILTNLGISTFVNNSTPGNFQFGAEQVYTAGATNRSMTSGDVNNDGQPDLVISYVTSGSLYKVGVLTSSFTPGGFTLSSIYELGALKDPVDLVLEDFNGDTKPDIAVANKNTNAVSVYKNTFNGSTVTFSAFEYYTVDASPLAVTIADFDGNGKPDISTTNRPGTSISILKNQIGAPFLANISPTTGGPGTAVTLTGYNFSNITGVYFGNTPAASYTVVSSDTIIAITGEGSDGLVTITTPVMQTSINGFTFAKPSITSFSPAFGPAGSAVTITGIGFSTNPDSNTVWFGAAKATVTNATPTSLTVLVPAGATWAPMSVTCYGATAYSSTPFVLSFGGNAALDSTSFSARVHLKINNFSTVSIEGVAIGDFNGDGKSDLAANANGAVYVFTNNGTVETPSWSSPIQINSTGGPAILVADFNADRKLDLVTGGAGGTVYILLNTSTGSTISFNKLSFATDVVDDSRLAVGDFDGDARPDIALAPIYSPNIILLRNTSTNQGTSFSTLTGPALAGENPQDIVAADLNADGKPELVVTDYNGLQAAVYKNTSTSTISFAAAYPLALNGYSFACAAGDLDADGLPDIVVSKLKQNSRPAFSVFKNNSSTGGDMAFTLSGEYPLEYEAYAMTITDINGDSKPEVIAANGTYNSKVSIFRNISTSGAITLASGVSYATGTEPLAVLAGDLNGDGKPDIVTANRLSNLYTSTGGLYILYNLLPGETPNPDRQASPLAVKAGPNPFISDITVQVETQLDKAKLQLVDMSGTILQTWEYKTLPAGASVHISKPGLKPGFYYLVLATPQGRRVLRIVKQ